MIRRNKSTCHSCGEPIASEPERSKELTPAQNKAFVEFQKTHCRTCALEKAGGPVPNMNLQHDAGSGRRVIRSTRGLS